MHIRQSRSKDGLADHYFSSGPARWSEKNHYHGHSVKGSHPSVP